MVYYKANMNKLIKSKRRVIDHGEVMTPAWLVNDMLELVKEEAERFDSRFLEPACGNGNFLAEILERKLKTVKRFYANNQNDYEARAILALASIYGIDILKDNITECRKRLFDIIDRHYTATFPGTAKEKFRDVARFILQRNIIWGDALAMKTKGKNPKDIVFSKWSLVNRNMIKRSDFTMRSLLHESPPQPTREFPPTHCLKIKEQK